MRILITASRSRLGQAIVKALGAAHGIQSMDQAAGGDPAPTFVGDGRDIGMAAEAIAGCDAVIHTPPIIPPHAPPEEILDAATRSTYNLIMTAPAGCRIITISNLSNFEGYPEYPVEENRAPRPTSEVRDLTTYLVQITVRELARVRPIKAIILRLEEVVTDEDIRQLSVDSRWLHIEDAVQAVERALVYQHPTGPFTIPYAAFHIVGAGKRTRFPLTAAARVALGFKPDHDLTAGVPLPIPVAPRREVRRLTDKPGGDVHKIAIFGARGALGTRVSLELARDHALKLTDQLSVEDYARAPIYAQRTCQPHTCRRPPTFPHPTRTWSATSTTPSTSGLSSAAPMPR